VEVTDQQTQRITIVRNILQP